MRFLFVALSFLPVVAHADACPRVAVWRDGEHVETRCRDEAIARGLTVLDLGDEWTPPVLAPAADATAPSYRSAYLALAQERFADAGPDGALAENDRYLELFGVMPALGVVRARLADDGRHACHDAIDDTPLARSSLIIREESAADGRARIALARSLRTELAHEQARKQLADLDALAAIDTYHRRAVARLRSLERYIASVRVVQAHLACDALFASPPIDGAFTWQTSNALAVFQRGSLILPSGTLDAQTREAMQRGSRERDFRTALRGLRERVIAATGLVEDGSAGAGEATVLDRALAPSVLSQVRGHAPLADAAPDLVSPATEAAARALGWTDPQRVRASLEAIASGETPSVVAVSLPALPDYHSATMELSVDIDRGDVWRTPGHSAARRPALVLYTSVGDKRIPLARWPTTIGGWQKQNVDGDVVKQWKESPVGERIWRDLYVGPSWLPPASTPDHELVRRSGEGYVLARDQLGPSYRAAFGLVAFIHLAEEKTTRGTEYWDQGIRTHGTGNLTSLANGVSHGCHRLLGIHAVRLANFVLAHRSHVRHGDTPTYYRRVVRAHGTFPIAIDSLGYRIELAPPLRINVLRGTEH